MASTTENMVLRTVYLPPDLDQQLKAAALLDEKSKNDLIRELIDIGIATLKDKNDDRFKVFAKAATPVKTRKSVAVRVHLKAESALKATSTRVAKRTATGRPKKAAADSK